jgi:hypothetical protein
MMTQGLLPFQYKIENSESGLTSFSGLPLYMDLAMTTKLCAKIAGTLKTKAQGWSDLQIIMSLILLNIVGGDCVDDIERLESDAGMRTLLLKTETHGMRRKDRRAYEKRFRQTKNRAFPSAPVIRRYLEQFHHAEAESLREEGKAFIPASNKLLQDLLSIHTVLAEFAQENNPVKTATLDQDATLSATNKRTSFYCYQKFKAYQPFNTYWHEQGLLLHSEFRDGNVNAGFEQLRLLKASLEVLPEGVEEVYLRSDSAGYQQDLLRYCAEGKNERFGVIKFAIAARVTGAFKAAVLDVKDEAWQPIYKQDDNGCEIQTNQEWSEVCFVPHFVAVSDSSTVYRYIAIRERMSAQAELEGLEPIQKELPFQTLKINNADYKLFGMVTNRSNSGNELINWHRERCGDSEKVHSIEKTDLAGGQFPSNKFGANAAWWSVMVMAFNLNELMKRLALPEELRTKRLKGLRFHVINVAGRLVQHARGLYIKLSGGVATEEKFRLIRQRIIALGLAPPGVLTG